MAIRGEPCSILHPDGIQAAEIYPYQSWVQCVHQSRKHNWYVAAHFPPGHTCITFEAIICNLFSEMKLVREE